MQTLTVMVGLPASGKSTYAQQLVDENTVVLSSDLIRKELFGFEENQTGNTIVFKTLYSRARELFKNGKNVIIDATNVSIFDRKRVLENFTDLSIYRQAIVIETSIDKCVERDKARTRTVGKDVIKKYANKYQKPTYSEGFDKIIFVKN